MGEVNIIGVNPAKKVLQLHGTTVDGSVVFCKRLWRLLFACFATSRD